MEWIAYVIVMIVVAIVSYYAAMKAQKAQTMAPGSVTQPTVNQGDRFPLLFGTREITSPKIVWMGSTSTEAIQK